MHFLSQDSRFRSCPARASFGTSGREFGFRKQRVWLQERTEWDGLQAAGQCAWQRLPGLPPLSFLAFPFFGTSLVPKFLKLSPVFKAEQLQDGYFCCFFLRGSSAPSLPLFLLNKNGEKGPEKTR